MRRMDESADNNNHIDDDDNNTDTNNNNTGANLSSYKVNLAFERLKTLKVVS